MAIQMRRGLLANYDESKMVAGEIAVTTDSTDADQQVLVAFAPGDSKRILTDTDLDSTALTGTPTAPTAAAGTNTTQVATTAFVHAEVASATKTLTVTDKGSGTVELGLA